MFVAVAISSVILVVAAVVAWVAVVAVVGCNLRQWKMAVCSVFFDMQLHFSSLLLVNCPVWES